MSRSRDIDEAFTRASHEHGSLALMGAGSLRIGVYSEVGHPDSPLVSGVTNLIHQFLAYSRTRPLDVELVTYGERDEVRAEGGVELVSIRPRLPLEVYKDLALDAVPLAPRWTRRGVDSRPDLVLAFAPGPIGRLGMRVAAEAGVPAIAFYTTDFPRYVSARCAKAGLPVNLCQAAERAVWTFQRSFYESTPDVVLAPSRATAMDIAQYLDAPIDVLGRGVDVDRFRPTTETRPEGPIRLLYVGRVHVEEKNLGLLEEVARELPHAEITVVGDGPHVERLQSMLGRRVRFRGKLMGDDLVAAYRAHDMFVFPSKFDTLGQVVLEAMASGPAGDRHRPGRPEGAHHERRNGLCGARGGLCGRRGIRGPQRRTAQPDVTGGSHLRRDPDLAADLRAPGGDGARADRRAPRPRRLTPTAGSACG